MKYVVQDIEGSGGGKGGGGGGSEAPNTLQNNSMLQLLHLLGEGPIEGLATGDGQSIFFNNVPLAGANNVFNFGGVGFTFETGTANQAYIPGFANVTSIVGVNEEVFNAFPQTYTVSSTAVDAATVTLGLPNGLKEIDDKGNINGYTVGIKIETKPHSSNSWTNVYNVSKTGKTDGNFQWQVYTTRPAAAANATWDIRVTRTSADDDTANVVSTLQFINVVEIDEIKESYDTTAVCGMSINAQQFGTNIPTISFLLKGVTVQVPSNYNANTRVYTGTWDGTFHTAFTNNPAWICYDMLTNPQYGGGVYGVTEDQVDKFSFYNAGVFCDVLVPSGITGQTEPRFTFDAPIQQRGDFLSTALQIAGMMNANLIYVGGLLILNQDRPANSVMAITKTNTLLNSFEYVGTPLAQRITAVNATYADKANYYAPRVSVTQNTAAANIYGYNCADISAFGATTEGQAIRAAKWYLYTSLNQTETVNFKMGLNGNLLNVGDVVDVYDEDYTQQAGAGKVRSANSNTVILDQPVVISGSTPMLGILLPDGVTYAYYDITNATGTSNTITIANTFSQVPTFYNDYIILSAIKPRTFRIMDIKQGDTPQERDFNAVFYNSGNYEYIEDGVALPTNPYSLTQLAAIGDPTDIQVREIATNVQLGESIVRGLLISWSPPTTNTATNYELDYRFNSGIYKTVAQITTNSYDLENVQPGQYDFILYSVNAGGLKSTGNNFSYTISVSGNATSNLLAPTAFEVANAGGNTFSGQDLSLQWTNPVNNYPANTGATLKDFRLDILNSTFSQVLDSYFVPAVAAGQDQFFLYTFADNTDDYGIPSRTVYATVYARDTGYNLSSGNPQIFINPPPATMAGAVTPLANSALIQLTYPTDSDFAGVLVWRGTSNTFTLSSATLIFDGKSNLIADQNLTPGTTYYWCWAAYDTFSHPYDGSGLNVSAVVSATPTNVGIPGGPTLPGTGTEGDLFFDTTDGQLYRYHSGAWTVAVPAVNITGNITDAQIAALSAAKLTGTITTTQIAANAITTPLISAGAIQTAQLAANSVVATTIAANSVTASQLAANSVTTNSLAVNSVTAGKINVNAVTANTIAAGAVTATALAVNSVTAAAIDVANLAAVSATIGTLRTASSGARVEISDNIITVYDSSNNVRVKLGVF